MVARADSRRHLPAALALAADGVIDPLAVPSRVVDWADAQAAWMVPHTKLIILRN